MRRSRGFALILALFLIVSLAAIGTYLLTVSNVQVQTAVMDEQGAGPTRPRGRGSSGGRTRS
jgi:hypothetical protein